MWGKRSSARRPNKSYKRRKGQNDVIARQLQLYSSTPTFNDEGQNPDCEGRFIPLMLTSGDVKYAFG